MGGKNCKPVLAYCEVKSNIPEPTASLADTMQCRLALSSRQTCKERNISLVRYVGPSDWPWYHAAIGIIRYITVKAYAVVFYKQPLVQLLQESIIDFVRCSEASVTPRGTSCSNPIWDRLSPRLKHQFVPICIWCLSISSVSKTMHRKKLELLWISPKIVGKMGIKCV